MGIQGLVSLSVGFRFSFTQGHYEGSGLRFAWGHWGVLGLVSLFSGFARSLAMLGVISI